MRLTHSSRLHANALILWMLLLFGCGSSLNPATARDRTESTPGKCCDFLSSEASRWLNRPTEQNFRALVIWLQKEHREGELTEEDQTAVRNALRTWPDDQRRAPDFWIEHLVEGEPVPLMGLARAISLEELELDVEQVQRLFEAIDKQKDLRITHLNLSDSNGRTKIVELLRSHSFTEEIEYLDLTSVQLGDAGLEMLVTSPQLRSVTQLSLASTAINFDRVESLTGSESWFRQVTHLDLSGNRLRPSHLLELSTNLDGARWRSLNLDHVSFDDTPAKKVEELFRSKPFEALERLSLRHSEFNDLHLERLAKSPRLKSLRHLDLSNNIMVSAGLRWIMKSDHIESLTSLDISRTGTGYIGLEAIATSPNAETIEDLNLSFLNLTAPKLRPLAESDALRGLRSVDLTNTNLDEGTIHILARANFVPSLRVLKLGGNCIDATMLSDLFGGDDFENLRSLDLTNNDLQNHGVTSLLDQRPLSNRLQNLSLARNGINDVGALDLAEDNALEDLRSLDLGLNYLTGKGAMALLESESLTGLDELHLDSNSIDDRGVENIAESEQLSRLRFLDLRLNQAGSKSADVLLNSQFRRESSTILISEPLTGEWTRYDVRATRSCY